MPYLSKTSRERLLTCDDRLVRVACEVIKVMDFGIACGHRTPEEQEALYAIGRTIPGQKVTWTLKSFHNHEPSLAFDFFPWTPGVGADWTNRPAFTKLAGAFLYVGGLYGYELTWGGDFPKKKRDMPHLQIEARPTL